MFNNYNFSEYDFNECSSKGACSILPNVSAIQEIIVVLIRETAYYLKKLKTLGLEFKNVELEILHALSEFISVAEYTDEEILIALRHFDKNLGFLQRKYLSICKNKNINCATIPNFIGLDDISHLAEIVALGEKLYLKKIKTLSKEEKFFSDILLLTLKSISMNVLKLSDYDLQSSKVIDRIINCLNLLNHTKLSIVKLEQAILDIIKSEKEILEERAKLQIQHFGKASEVMVSASSRKNKAVLVSGSSLIDLYNILEFTKKETGLDVYTHGDLLVAHSFEKFRKYPQLVGHYGASNENCLLDFTTFPGAILLTRHSRQNIEHLIRGRIFTMDTVQPKGAIKVLAKDFDKVVESSKLAKGFKKGQIRNDIKVGFNEGELEENIELIKQKFSQKEIKRILFIGMSPKSPLQEMYLNNIVKNLSKETFVISFTKLDVESEHLEINVANNFPLMYSVTEKLFKKLPLTEYPMSFYLLKCDTNSISGIIQLKNYGAKRIMLGNCSPTTMNPATLTTFAKKYGVHLITTPQQDVKILEN